MASDKDIEAARVEASTPLVTVPPDPGAGAARIPTEELRDILDHKKPRRPRKQTQPIRVDLIAQLAEANLQLGEARALWNETLEDRDDQAKRADCFERQWTDALAKLHFWRWWAGIATALALASILKLQPLLNIVLK